MGVQLADLLDVDLLARHVRDGYVSVRDHPEAPLQILNYTAAAQYDRAWDDVTRQCRGLIVHTGWDDVVARPWPKFHNYGEHEEGTLDLDALVEVTDKLDGSLGILYPAAKGQWAIATRGSFESEQAIRGTRMWRDNYSHMRPEPGWTFLFEIIYPENRIVVDYAGAEDLVLLGAVTPVMIWPMATSMALYLAWVMSYVAAFSPLKSKVFVNVVPPNALNSVWRATMSSMAFR